MAEKRDSYSLIEDLLHTCIALHSCVAYHGAGVVRNTPVIAFELHPSDIVTGSDHIAGCLSEEEG